MYVMPPLQGPHVSLNNTIPDYVLYNIVWVGIASLNIYLKNNNSGTGETEKGG